MGHSLKKVTTGLSIGRFLVNQQTEKLETKIGIGAFSSFKIWTRVKLLIMN